ALGSSFMRRSFVLRASARWLRPVDRSAGARAFRVRLLQAPGAEQDCSPALIGHSVTMGLGEAHAHGRRGSDGLAALEPEKASSLFLRLEFGLVDVEVHTIDALDFQAHMVTKDVSNAPRYTHGWLRSTPILRDHCRLERPNKLGLRTQTPNDRPEPFL